MYSNIECRQIGLYGSYYFRLHIPFKSHGINPRTSFTSFNMRRNMRVRLVMWETPYRKPRLKHPRYRNCSTWMCKRIVAHDMTMEMRKTSSPSHEAAQCPFKQAPQSSNEVKVVMWHLACPVQSRPLRCSADLWGPSLRTGCESKT